MQIGLTKRIIKRKTGYNLPLTVPQLVNSSRTIFFGTYQPRKRQVMMDASGISSCAVKLSQLVRKSLPKKPNPGTAPWEREQNTAMMLQVIVSIHAPLERVILRSS